ncbi:MAG TPA: choice-of-anchor G family protein, partial [Galbitalea sp.]
MFNHSTSSTGEDIQRSTGRILTKALAMAVAGTLGTALSLAAPLSASAANPAVSYGSGQFLAGTVGGMNLAKLAAVEAASAQNNGSQSTQVSRDPLGVSALGATLIHQPAGIQLNLGKVIDLGAANQYAQAASDGSSYAASGAVNNDGGIGVGKVGTAADGSATVDLDSLLGSKFASVLSDLKLDTSDVSAQAAGALKNASGSYTLADLNLDFTS